MRSKDRNKKKFQELKRALTCSHCGLQDYRVMDFHHLDEESKEGNISRLVKDGYSWKRIEEEMAKCICLCSNCHRIEHSVTI